MGTFTVFEQEPVGADANLTTFDGFAQSMTGVVELSQDEVEILTFDVTRKLATSEPTFSEEGSVFYGAAFIGVPGTSQRGFDWDVDTGELTGTQIGTLVPFAPETGIFQYFITHAEWVAAGSPEVIEIAIASQLTETSEVAPGVFQEVVTNIAPAYYDLLLCFAPGTAIATPTGERTVETLAVGDLIRTADGRNVPVHWLGRQTVSTRFGPADRLRLVRVTAGALGDGLPLRDLVLTSDHALLVEGLLVTAGALVNGGSVDFVPLTEFDGSYTVYHIETEAHDVILAEGAPAETYIDYAARASFDNYAEYLELYAEDRTIPEMAYPRISSARLVPASVRTRIAGRTAA